MSDLKSPAPFAGDATVTEAWELAIEMGRDSARDLALDRAINGTATPIFYGGRQCGERRTYHDSLLIAALRSHEHGLPTMTPGRSASRGRPQPRRDYSLSPEQVEREREEYLENERRLTEQGYYNGIPLHRRGF